MAALRWPLVLVALVMAMALAGGLAVPAAADSPVVTGVSVAQDFPTSVTFRARVQADAPIVRAVLNYTVQRRSCAPVVTQGAARVVPGALAPLEWTLDMARDGSLPPGARLRYWWEVEDAQGRRTTSAPEEVVLTDARYAWRSVEAADPELGRVEVLWYSGSEAFARELLDAAMDGLRRLRQSTGATLAEPVRMYIYGSARDLQSALVFSSEWTGGVAFSDFNVIALGIAPDNLAWGRDAVVHELTHLVLGQVTYHCLSSLPLWLNEGLATYNEGPGAARYRDAVERAARDDRLMPLRWLGGAFPHGTAEAEVAYGQSYDTVAYLLERYGPDPMLAVLRDIGSGVDAARALQRAYGLDVDGLDQAWRDARGYPPLKTVAPTPTPTRGTFTPVAPPGTTTPGGPTAAPGGSPTPTPAPGVRGACTLVTAAGPRPALSDAPLLALGLLALAAVRRRANKE